MALRSFLHKVIDKSFNTIDKTKSAARKGTKNAAAHVAERLSKDPTDIKLARLEKERQALIAEKQAAKSTKQPNKNHATPQTPQG